MKNNSRSTSTVSPASNHLATVSDSPADSTTAPLLVEVVRVIEAEAPVSADEALASSLSPEQREAIQHLTNGRTLAASAAAAGVNRTTLYRWLRDDPAFLAVYNTWQKDVVDTARARILALSDLAVSTLAKSMSRGDARTAATLLKAIGALDRPNLGSTDPAEVRRLQNLEVLKAKTALTQAENRAEMDAHMAV